MYAVPAFIPFTLPEETETTDFLEELHFTFFLLPDTFSDVEAPRLMVTADLFSFIFAAWTPTGLIKLPRNKTTSASQTIVNFCFPMLHFFAFLIANPPFLKSFPVAAPM